MPGERIETNPKVMMGKPVVAGTRVTVEAILEKLAHGNTSQDIVEAYPHLDEKDVQAALEYAANAMKTQVTVSTGSDKKSQR